MTLIYNLNPQLPEMAELPDELNNLRLIIDDNQSVSHP